MLGFTQGMVAFGKVPPPWHFPLFSHVELLLTCTAGGNTSQETACILLCMLTRLQVELMFDLYSRWNTTPDIACVLLKGSGEKVGNRERPWASGQLAALRCAAMAAAMRDACCCRGPHSLPTQLLPCALGWRLCAGLLRRGGREEHCAAGGCGQV